MGRSELMGLRAIEGKGKAYPVIVDVTEDREVRGRGSEVVGCCNELCYG